jgi:hypothetical protein
VNHFQSGIERYEFNNKNRGILVNPLFLFSPQTCLPSKISFDFDTNILQFSPLYAAVLIGGNNANRTKKQKEPNKKKCLIIYANDLVD